ncbi:MAG: antibiotic biosynthesis monooxygenase [Leptospiraceae bacterium]|nr:antibiotic biosynthesis monooxygenase [Leptospiraceae bacterium]
MKTSKFFKSKIIGLLLSILLLGLGINCKETSQSDSIMEVAVYKIKKDQIQNSAEFTKTVDVFLQSREGFISIQRLQDVNDPSIFTDLVLWKTKEDAELSAKASETEASLVPFFEAIEKMIHFGHNLPTNSKTK